MQHVICTGSMNDKHRVRGCVFSLFDALLVVVFVMTEFLVAGAPMSDDGNIVATGSLHVYKSHLVAASIKTTNQL